MIEFGIIGIIVAWATYQVWKTVRPGGCSCGGQCSACGGSAPGSCGQGACPTLSANNPDRKD